LANKFATATDFIQAVGLTNFASHLENGDAETNRVTPFSLRFEPHSDVKDLFSKDAPDDGMKYVDQLCGISADSTLYKVYGMTAPLEEEGVEVLIGDLVLDGSLVKS
jgi:hypothetical protein